MNNDPLAYFITWTCYGTWLPGDDRGWTKWHKGDQIPQPLLADWCRDQMVEKPVLLNDQERNLVNETVARHCEIRAWHLYAVNCRTNHCHCVIAAGGHGGEQVRDQLKLWCTRKLKEFHLKRKGASPPVAPVTPGGNHPTSDIRRHWWTRKGSVRHLFDEQSLEAAIFYTLQAQDEGGSKAN